MPYFKDYGALSAYVEKHPGEQITVRVRTVEYIKGIKRCVEELRELAFDRRKAVDTLQAYVALCEDEPLLKSDLHTAMDAAMLGVRLSDAYEALSGRATLVYDGISSIASAPDSDQFTSAGEKREVRLFVIRREALERLSESWSDVETRGPWFMDTLPDPYSSRQKLSCIGRHDPVGVFQTFPSPVVEKVKQTCEYHKYIFGFIDLLEKVLNEEELM